MSVLALRCPHCAKELPSAPERRVFVCDACARSWCLDSIGRALVALPRRVLRPLRPLPADGRIVLLPFWRLFVPEAVLRSSGERLPAEIRLPAVGLQRSSLLLRWSEQLSRAGGLLEESRAWHSLESLPGPAPEPAEVAPEDAYELSELLVLRMIKGWPPEDEVESWEIPFSSPELFDWPCVQRRGELEDLLFGRAISDALVSGRPLADQRARIRSLESVGA